MENTSSQPTNTLYISNFPRKTQKQQLEKVLQSYGKLTSLNIIYKSQFAFAFAQFDDIRDAVYAVKQLNQKVYQGMNLKVQFRNKKLKQKEQAGEDKFCYQQKKRKSDEINSPNSAIQTNCNLPPQKIQQRQKPEKRANNRQQQKFQRKQRTKNGRREASQEFSASRSRSRSRSKGRNIKNYRKHYEDREIKRSMDRHHGFSYKGREDSCSRSPDFHRHYSQSYRPVSQQEMFKMFEIVRNLQRHIHKLQDKFSDFIYDLGFDQRHQSRRRN